MALFTDGPAVGAEELARYETSVLEVLRVEQVPLDVKVALAQEACGLEVAEFVRRNWAYGQSSDEDILSRVVVDARLRRWIALETLSCVFGDVYSRQLNDRYAKKQAVYQELVREARDSCLGNGVGLVSSPIPRASRPAVVTEPGTGGASGTFYVSVAECRTGGEGAPSETVAIAVSEDSRLRVSSTGLALWSVYVGTNPAELKRQNEQPISGPDWRLNEVSAAAPLAPNGQRADVIVRWQRRMRRG